MTLRETYIKRGGILYFSVGLCFVIQPYSFYKCHGLGCFEFLNYFGYVAVSLTIFDVGVYFIWNTNDKNSYLFVKLFDVLVLI